MGPVIFSLALFGRYKLAQISLRSFLYNICTFTIPGTVIVPESEDGLLLDTVQVYSPPVVTECVYCAVSGSSNTVSVPSVTVMESLVQVTVVYSRSSSGDTGEGHLVRVKCHFVS